MKTVIYQKDIIDEFKNENYDVMIHGCNCQKSFGGGLAYQMACRLPRSKEADEKSSLSTLNRLGNFSYAKYKSKTIINLYTQFNPGRDFNLAALEVGLIKINKIFKGKNIILPAIGCGIGGGKFREVRNVIIKTLTDVNYTVILNDENHIVENILYNLYSLYKNTLITGFVNSRKRKLDIKYVEETLERIHNNEDYQLGYILLTKYNLDLSPFSSEERQIIFNLNKK